MSKAGHLKREKSNKNCENEDGDVVVYEQSDLHSTTFPIMTDLRRNNLLCDVTIKLNEVDWAFGAHRVILAATCKLLTNAVHIL